MKSEAKTIEQYLDQLSVDRKSVFEQLRKTVLDNLPLGFEEMMSYGMIGYVVPHSIYPAGYHCDPKLPLPFINIASQKQYIALYHMGIYANAQLLEWFKAEYSKHCKSKLDMGKSCIRFKKVNEIPMGLIGALCSKMTPKDWIDLYEASVK